MDPRRAERVVEALREELDELIAFELEDPRIQNAGVVEVLMSPDARHAHVRVRTDPDPKAQKDVLDALDHAKGFIRRQLAQRLDIFRVPELHFEAALSASLEARAQSVLKRIRKGRPRDLS